MRAPNRARLPQSTALALCLSMFSGSVALAADPIVLRPGFSELIGPSILPRSVGQIFVGNADVVDVTLQNDRQIVITAKVFDRDKVPGATNLIILDTQNNEMFRADIVVTPPPALEARIPTCMQPRIPGLVQVHSRGRQQLHEYYAYICPPTTKKGNSAAFAIGLMIHSKARFVSVRRARPVWRLMASRVSRCSLQRFKLHLLPRPFPRLLPRLINRRKSQQDRHRDCGSEERCALVLCGDGRQGSTRPARRANPKGPRTEGSEDDAHRAPSLVRLGGAA